MKHCRRMTTIDPSIGSNTELSRMFAVFNNTFRRDKFLRIILLLVQEVAVAHQKTLVGHKSRDCSWQPCYDDVMTHTHTHTHTSVKKNTQTTLLSSGGNVES